MDFDLRSRTILLTVAGSRAYGIHLPTSDVDAKGVCIATAPYYLGYLNRFEQADKPSHMATFLDLFNEEEHAAISAEKLEGTVYELRKFVGLAAQGNPNILDALFCRDAEVRLLTPLGKLLRDHRDMFISAKCKFTFSGYAHSQLNRIRGHRAWLLNPPDHQPTRGEFGLPENTLIPADQLAAAQASVRKQMDSWELDMQGCDPSLIEHVQEQVTLAIAQVQTALGYPRLGQDSPTHGSSWYFFWRTPEDAKWLAAARLVGLDDNLIYVMQKEREYEAAQRYWRQYSEWKRNRNPARAELEAKYGFDVKHGSHLYRLLKMGREILETGRVHVWRGSEDGGPGDAEEIRSIRNGAWTYDHLIEWAEAEDAAINRIYTEKKYVIPKQPDQKGIDKLCIRMIEEAIK